MFEESQLLGNFSEKMLFRPGTLAFGTSYVEEFWKGAELLPCLQLRMIHTDELLEGCYVKRVMLDAFAFFDLWSANDKGRNSDSSVHMANYVRSYSRTLLLTPSRHAGRSAGGQAGR
jgi:hypothetical protein